MYNYRLEWFVGVQELPFNPGGLMVGSKVLEFDHVLQAGGVLPSEFLGGKLPRRIKRVYQDYRGMSVVEMEEVRVKCHIGLGVLAWGRLDEQADVMARELRVRGLYPC